MGNGHQIPTLGKLESVPIKSVWTSEPYAFDPWLSQPENLQFLSDALGLPGLELLKAQSPVGPFAADLICQVIGTEQKVVIENQLDKADHRHLGQVLTYAPHHDAKICVWVAAEICDEHRAAVDWLNRISNDEIAFFAVEVRAVRIGDSLPAPLFDVVARPNDWSKLSASDSSSGSAASDYQLSNMEFWQLFELELTAAGGAVRRNKKPLKETNYYGPLTDNGRAYVAGWRAQSGKPNVGAYLGIYGTHAPLVWNHLLNRQEELDQAFGEPLVWSSNKQETVFKVMPAPFYSLSDKANWPEQHSWMVKRMVRLRDVFEKPVLQAIADCDSEVAQSI